VRRFHQDDPYDVRFMRFCPPSIRPFHFFLSSLVPLSLTDDISAPTADDVDHGRSAAPATANQ
jgi:hypothetical protein